MNVWLIVALVIALGLVVGNILLLKHSAKMKFEKKPSTPPSSNTDDTKND